MKRIPALRAGRAVLALESLEGRALLSHAHGMDLPWAEIAQYKAERGRLLPRHDDGGQRGLRGPERSQEALPTRPFWVRIAPDLTPSRPWHDDGGPPGFRGPERSQESLPVRPFWFRIAPDQTRPRTSNSQPQNASSIVPVNPDTSPVRPSSPSDEHPAAPLPLRLLMRRLAASAGDDSIPGPGPGPGRGPAGPAGIAFQPGGASQGPITALAADILLAGYPTAEFPNPSSSMVVNTSGYVDPTWGAQVPGSTFSTAAARSLIATSLVPSSPVPAPPVAAASSAVAAPATTARAQVKADPAVQPAEAKERALPAPSGADLIAQFAHFDREALDRALARLRLDLVDLGQTPDQPATVIVVRPLLWAGAGLLAFELARRGRRRWCLPATIRAGKIPRIASGGFF